MRRLIRFLLGLPNRIARDRAVRRSLRLRGLCTRCGVRPATAGEDDCVYCWEADW